MKRTMKKKFIIAIFCVSSLPQAFCSSKVKICEVDVEKTIGNYFDSYVNNLINSQKITQKVANCLIDKAIEASTNLPEKAELIVFPAKNVQVPAMLGGTKVVTNKNQAPDAASIEKLKKTLEKMRNDCNAIIKSTKESIEYAKLNQLAETSWDSRKKAINRTKFSEEQEKRWKELKSTNRTGSYNPSLVQENQDKVTKIENLLKKLEPSPSAK